MQKLYFQQLKNENEKMWITYIVKHIALWK